MFVGGNQANIDPFTNVVYSGAKAAENYTWGKCPIFLVGLECE